MLALLGRTGQERRRCGIITKRRGLCEREKGTMVNTFNDRCSKISSHGYAPTEVTLLSRDDAALDAREEAPEVSAEDTSVVSPLILAGSTSLLISAGMATLLISAVSMCECVRVSNAKN